jgi:hypothetical protein
LGFADFYGGGVGGGDEGFLVVGFEVDWEGFELDAVGWLLCGGEVGEVLGVVGGGGGVVLFVGGVGVGSPGGGAGCVGGWVWKVIFGCNCILFNHLDSPIFNNMLVKYLSIVHAHLAQFNNQ